MINSIKKTVNFVSTKETDEERIMHSKSNNMEIIICDTADEVIEEWFEKPLSRYQI